MCSSLCLKGPDASARTAPVTKGTFLVQVIVMFIGKGDRLFRNQLAILDA